MASFDSRELIRTIKLSGYKMNYIAGKLNISAVALRNKLSGKSDFKLSEVQMLVFILDLDADKAVSIFFNHNVPS